MRKLKRILLVIAVCAYAIPSAFAMEKADNILGVWMNEDKDAYIEITKRDNKYFGKLVWLKFPIDDETGKEKLDKHNPDESLRSRPVFGLEILTNFEFNGNSKWTDGKIYDPKKGNTYSCYMKFVDDEKLKIRGYVGVSIIGRTTYWTKVKK
ncbi:MAG: hypothetical protein CL663_00960 [Bacteroidetes bacterium]|nr:hypothetical protein [Bacteroidota bacterium]|tara:strand:+ start:79 stop:534 length:456 start_codon:yes stop_codon:yes gene_type:complete